MHINTSWKALLILAIATMTTAASAHAVDISGVIFEDANFAGTASNFDGGVSDRRLPNVDVEIYDVNGVYVTSVVSDVNGSYLFSGLTPGTYSVRARSVTIGDANTPPHGGLVGGVPGTWPFPLAEMTWGAGSSRVGGGNANVDDASTGDNGGRGDTYVVIALGGVDAVNVHLGFAYNLVTNTGDDTNAGNVRSKQGSLRQAIKSANAIGTANGTTADNTQFRIPTSDPNYNGSGNGEFTIRPLAVLPSLAFPMVLDATTQIGYAGMPLIELDGSVLGGVNNGLTVTSTGTTIRGLVVNRFGQDGIGLNSGGSTTIERCLIGTDVTGMLDRGNSRAGIRIVSDFNTIGGTTAGKRNIISGNNVYGIEIRPGAIKTVVRGNFIGTNIVGSSAIANGASGVFVNGDSTTVGGTVAGSRNLISGNTDGVQVSNASHNIIQGNYAGTDSTGTLALPNIYSGIWIRNASTGNLIGGTAAGARNVISGNGHNGITLGNGSTFSLVQGNLVGTDASGTVALENGTNGILIDATSSNNTVGGTIPAARNIISGNGLEGIDLVGTDNLIQGNYMGTDITGMFPIPNFEVAVWIRNTATRNLIGGTTPGARNVMSGNREDGVNFANSTTGNVVQGNFIGTDATGTGPLKNNECGVNITYGAFDNLVGGTVPGASNLIAYNKIVGVALSDGPGSGNAILGNSIHSSESIGIDLGDGDGVTPNDPGDPDNGDNDFQNYPVLTSAIGTPVSVAITGSLNSTPSDDFRIEFFSNSAQDPTGHGEGETFLGATTASTNAQGNAAFVANLPVGVGPGEYISSTATNLATMSTSEFSLNVQAVQNNIGPQVVAAIPDTSVVEDSAPVANYRDLNNVFSDVEDGSALGFSLQSNSNPGLVTATIDPDSALDFSFASNTTGSATLVIRATDSGSLFVEDTLVVTVTPANDPPTVVAAMPDTSVVEDSAPVNNYRDLNNVFSDLENGSALGFSVQNNSNPGLLTATIDADSALDFSFASNTTGSATLVIRATDSGSLFVEDTFIVTVTPANDPPVVVVAIPDTSVVEDSAPVANYRDLNNVFGDVENGSALGFAVQSNSNPGLVTATIDADSALDFSFATNTTGSATVVIRATDSGSLFVEDTLVVTVTPANDPPVVVVAIPDTSVVEDSAPVSNYRDLNAVFTDLENGSALGFSVQSNSNPGLLTATIDADSALDFSFAANATGSATLVIRATDSGSLFVEDTFIVTVTPANDPPTVVAAIPDTSVVEDSAPVANYRDLNNVFGDVENGSALGFAVQSNSNPALVAATIDPDSALDFSFASNTTGSATLVIRATDSGSLFVEDTFIVTVTPANDPPVVVAAIPDTSVVEDSAPVNNYRDLNNVFSDVENGSALGFSVQSNSNPALVTATIDPDSALDLSFASNATGSATLVIRATDSGSLFVEDTFIVTVTPANDPPTVVAAIPDTSVVEDSAPVNNYRDLNNVFNDAENGSALGVSVQSNSNPALVTSTIDPDSALDLSFASNATGSATLVIRATDSGSLFVEDTFIVTVTSDSPVVTIATSPSGLAIFFDAASYTSPQQFEVTGGSNHQIAVNTIEERDDTMYVFSSWSDGGARSHQITMGDDDSTFTASFQPTFAHAVIDSIVDVPNDEGGWARVYFQRSGLDRADEDSIPIAAYDVHRKVADEALIESILKDGTPMDGDFGSDREMYLYDSRHFIVNSDVSAAPPGVWEVVGNVSAQQKSHYIRLVPTLADSAETPSLYAYYYVSAHTTTPSIFFESPVDSGYSVDNLDPGVPSGFSVTYNSVGGNELAWLASPELDLQQYKIYRSTNPSFTPGPEYLVHATSDTQWVDGVIDPWRYTYKLSALDHAGNESEYATAGTVTGVDTPTLAGSYVLHQNSPNPFNPTTIIRYDVPAPGGQVTLRVYDSSGRLVRVLVDDFESSGTKSVVWDGRNAQGTSVATGVFFYELQAPGFRRTLKMTLLK